MYGSKESVYRCLIPFSHRGATLGHGYYRVQSQKCVVSPGNRTPVPVSKVECAPTILSSLRWKQGEKRELSYWFGCYRPAVAALFFCQAKRLSLRLQGFVMLLEFELCHLEIVEQSERLALCHAGCTRGIHLGFMVDVRPS